MISFGLIVVVGILYWNSLFFWALLVTVAAIANGLLAVVTTVMNPSWYIQKRLEAGLDARLDLKGLLIAKALLVVPLSLLAVHLASRAGLL